MSKSQKPQPPTTPFQKYANAFDTASAITTLVEWTVDAIDAGQFDNNELVENSTLFDIAGWLPPEQTSRPDVQRAQAVERTIISQWVDKVSELKGRKPTKPVNWRLSGYLIPPSNKIVPLVEQEALRTCRRALAKAGTYMKRVQDGELSPNERVYKKNAIARMSHLATMVNGAENTFTGEDASKTPKTPPTPPWM